MTTGEIVGLSLTLIVMLAGLLGCIVPGFPGTLVVLSAAIGHRLYFGPDGISNIGLIVLMVLMLLAQLFDFLAGLFGASKFGATWRGAVGALLGGMVGLVFGLLGIILGPFVGATLFELFGGREWKKATRAGLGAVVGLFVGIVGKFSIAVVMILLFTVNVIQRSPS